MRTPFRTAIFVVVFMSALAWSLWAQEVGDYPWGASPSVVAGQTGAEPDVQGSGALVKGEQVFGREATVSYQFNSNRLSSVGIQWDQDLFTDIANRLSARFPNQPCTPSGESCTWKTATETIHLLVDSSLGVTFLVFTYRQPD